MVLLVLGGAVGFATTLLGLILPVTRYASVFGGGLQVWSKNRWTVGLCAAAVLGGLGLMFVSLLLARGVERSNALMRRLMYGYNAFFSSFLLLAVLLLINVLGYWPLSVFGALQKTYDWTANAVYTLQQGTIEQLAQLKKPVHVIVLLSGRSEDQQAMATLLENCREVQPKLTWDEYSPELLAREDPEKLFELQQKYELPREMHGIVVVYGTEAESTYTFIPESSLSQEPPSPFDENPQPTKTTFKGEAALDTAIDFLEGGKAKTVIYFTQGSGELSFEPEGEQEQGNGSMSLFKEGLSGGNYDLRPLPLDQKTKEIPSDANIVVIARPTSALPAPAVDALRAYLKGTNGKPGKLIALAQPRRYHGRAGLRGPRSGGAAGGIRRAPRPRPRPLRHDPRRGRFAGERPRYFRPEPDRGFVAEAINFLPFENVQSVQPTTTNPAFRAETILQANPNYAVWSQKDLHASVDALKKKALDELQQRDDSRFSDAPLSVAVAVSEAGGAPPIPGHEFMGPQPGKPVMMVFGDGEWIGNDALSAADSDIPLNVFRNAVDWLRERPAVSEQIKSKKGVERDEFSMAKITPGAASAIAWTPGFVMLAGVVALGLGVAVARRR